MTKKLKVYCPYSALDLEWETLKNLQNITFEKPWYLKEIAMTQEDKDYLVWRCKTSWHNKYHHYINEWIDNIIPTQLEYLRREKENLIKKGIYDTRK